MSIDRLQLLLLFLFATVVPCIGISSKVSFLGSGSPLRDVSVVTAVPIALSFSLPHPPSSCMMSCQYFQASDRLRSAQGCTCYSVVAVSMPECTDWRWLLLSCVTPASSSESDGTGCAKAAFGYRAHEHRHKLQKHRDQERVTGMGLTQRCCPAMPLAVLLPFTRACSI